MDTNEHQYERDEDSLPRQLRQAQQAVNDATPWAGVSDALRLVSIRVHSWSQMPGYGLVGYFVLLKSMFNRSSVVASSRLSWERFLL